ncbi:MAG: hypothetical protein DRR19_32135 [Candidatus Parabeggiatoa sp. nov. 1]|nr:MAG: hypothetical protein DRR19_32135 [Gammaproteobacteria bacterium]
MRIFKEVDSEIKDTTILPLRKVDARHADVFDEAMQLVCKTFKVGLNSKVFSGNKKLFVTTQP